MNITFLPQSISLQFEQGKTVLDLAKEAGVPIDGNCGGKGICGKCVIKLLVGSGKMPDEKEIAKLTPMELRNGYRLACRFKPFSDTVVSVTSIDGIIKRKTGMLTLPAGFKPDGRFSRIYIESSFFDADDAAAVMSKVKAACGLNDIKICKRLMRRLAVLLKKGDGITVTRRGNEIIGIESGNVNSGCYGIAFDIGTTAVSAYLWDLSTAKLIGADGAANPQSLHGADVIQRIAFAGEGKDSLRLLHKGIIDCLNDIALNLIDGLDIKLNNILEYVIVGNTTMSHLFLGTDPSGLAFFPFLPAFAGSVLDSAASIGLVGNECARFYLMPNIAGHVGSDIAAGVLATDIIKKAEQRYDNVHLLIDVGTNGEIVLAGKGQVLACSTAAGPAFEGASIYQGVRVSDGAIEKVSINGDVGVEIIGGGIAKGICGSGIIDAVSQMIRLGLIDKTGKLKEPKNISEAVRKRIRKGRNGNEFVLVYSDGFEDIVILQKDIREVQLAKAAIHAGINIMLKQMDAAIDDIYKIHLAGTFGNNIDIESALTIGLLPNVDREIIVFEGNAAGIGASMALLSEESRRKAEGLAKEIVHVELSADQGFIDEYLGNMGFD